MTTPEKELVKKLSQIALPDIPDQPDSETAEEITDYEEQHQKLTLQEHEQTIRLRKEFATKIFYLVIGWVIAMLVILVLQGFAFYHFALANSVILASRVSAKPAMRGHFKTGHSRPGTLDVVPIAALSCKSHF